MKKLSIVSLVAVFLLISLWTDFVAGQVPVNSIVRIGTNDSPNIHSYGSGVVTLYDDHVVILTAYHVVKDGKSHFMFYNDQKYPLILARIDSIYDYAILVEKTKSSVVKKEHCASFAQSLPQKGDKTFFAGFGGKFKVITGQFLGNVGRWILLSGGAVSGDSGGPMFNERGEIIGILWGTREGKTLGTSVEQLKMRVDLLVQKSKVESTPNQIVQSLPPGQCAQCPQCNHPFTDTPIQEIPQGRIVDQPPITSRFPFEPPAVKNPNAGDTLIARMDDRLQQLERRLGFRDDSDTSRPMIERIQYRLQKIEQRLGVAIANTNNIVGNINDNIDKRLYKLEQRLGLRPPDDIPLPEVAQPPMVAEIPPELQILPGPTEEPSKELPEKPLEPEPIESLPPFVSIDQLNARLDEIELEIESELKIQGGELESKINSVTNEVDTKIDSKLQEFNEKLKPEIKEEVQTGVKDLETKVNTKMDEISPEVINNVTEVTEVTEVIESEPKSLGTLVVEWIFTNVWGVIVFIFVWVETFLGTRGITSKFSVYLGSKIKPLLLKLLISLTDTNNKEKAQEPKKDE